MAGHVIAAVAVRLSGSARRLAAGDRTVALTFDDGPDPTYTPAVLDVLAELDVRASFFVVGRRAEAYPEIVERIVADGHAIASHGYAHLMASRVGAGALAEDYRRGRRAVEGVVRRQVRLFRPPYGDVDLRVAGLIRLLGLRSWLWSVDPHDWSQGASVDGIVACADHIRAGDVLLLHDCVVASPEKGLLDRWATVGAVPGLVERIRSRGLAPVALDWSGP